MLFRKMLREMRGNFGQFFSVFLLSMIALVCYIGFEANVIGGRQAMESFHEDTNVADGWLYGEGFTKDNLDAVSKLDFILGAQLRTQVQATAPDADDAQVDLYLQDEESVNKIFVIEGNGFDPDDADGIWISKAFADKRKLSVGDSFKISYNGITMTKTIRGLGETPEYEFRQAEKDPDVFLENITFAHMSYKGFPVREYANHLIENGTITAKKISEETDLLKEVEEKLADMGMTVEDITKEMLLERVEKISDDKLFELMPYTEMIVRVQDGNALDYEEEIATAIENNYAVMIDEASIVGMERLDAELKQHDAFASVFAGVFVLVAILIISTTMGRMVEKQRTQIGTMNAMGLKTSKIVFHYISYSFVLSLLGALVGLNVGLKGFGSFMVSMFSTFYVLPNWKAGFNEKGVLVMLIVVASCTLASYVTCRKIMKIKPAQALRPAPPKQGKHCIFEKLPFWNKLGFYTQYNLRDISRAKLRAFMGVVGTAVGMLMMVYGLACNLLVDTMFVWSFEKIKNFENQVVFSGDVKLSDAEKLCDDLDGELIMMNQVEIAKKKRAKSGEKTKQGITVTEGKGYFNITDGEQNILSIEPGTIALSHKVAEDMGISVGDTIYWHIYSENDWYEAKVGVINRSPESQGITYLREDYEKTGAEFIPSFLATDQDASFCKDEKFVSNVMTRQELKDAFDTSMEVVDLLLYFMVGFSVIMIVLVLYNSGNLSFNERIKEFATLKVLGLQTSQIRSILTLQNVWLTVIGILVGAPFGRATLESMMNSNGDQFDYSIPITPQVYIMSALLVLIVSMLVGFIFQKRIKKLDLVDVLKGVE
ncbi:MAG: ABC transporter permease [Eubacteriales bacterium]|nr:ABC transporter permease [Eubacteriales bacterium]